MIYAGRRCILNGISNFENKEREGERERERHDNKKSGGGGGDNTVGGRRKSVKDCNT